MTARGQSAGIYPGTTRHHRRRVVSRKKGGSCGFATAATARSRNFDTIQGGVTDQRGPHATPSNFRTTVKTTPFQLDGEYIELCNLLKLAGIADSGGHGKQLVAAGEVKVDGQLESRKTAKIRAGQSVECRGAAICVKAA